MNSIKAIVDQSDYEIYDNFLNIQIDGYWLDEKLDELYPDNMYKGLIPTLLFAMEIEKEKDTVWNRILPNEKSICPILMCPDDRDFSCTLIVAEIENCGQSIRWNRIGIDKTTDFEPDKVGTTVEWFDNLDILEFATSQYSEMLKEFKKQLEIDKKDWEERNRKLQDELNKN
ncbi:MAG: hypothetical protein ACO1OF_10690 [Adhaeribacter sp.]